MTWPERTRTNSALDLHCQNTDCIIILTYLLGETVNKLTDPPPPPTHTHTHTPAKEFWWDLYVCKVWKLLALQITQRRHPISVVDVQKCLVQHPKNMRKYIKTAKNGRCPSSICQESVCKAWIKRNEHCWSKFRQCNNQRWCRRNNVQVQHSQIYNKILLNVGGAHLQCVNNHYAKFECKGMKTVGSYRLHKPRHILSISDGKNVSSSTPLKNWENIYQMRTNMRRTSSMCKLCIMIVLELQITQTRHPKSATDGVDPLLDQGSKIALVRSYLRVPKAAGQVKILKFLVKIKFYPYMPVIFVMQGKCPFSDISRPVDLRFAKG